MNNGARIGTLCVIDRQPKQLDAKQREALHHLSVVVVEALKRRRATLTKVESDSPADQIVRTLGEGNWEWNVLNDSFVVNEAWSHILGQARSATTEPMSFAAWQTRFEPADRNRFKNLLAQLQSREIDALDGTFRLVSLKGRPLKVHVHAHVQLWTADDKPEWIAGTMVETAHAAAAPAKQPEEPTDWQLDIASRTMTWSKAVCQLYSVAPGYQPEFAEFLRIYPDDARQALERALNRVINLGEPLNVELPIVRPTGEMGRVRVVAAAAFDANQMPVRIEGSIETLG
jgi:PAS domain-containing protein